MRFLRRFFIRLSNFTTGRRADQRLQEEMAEHLALQTEENLRAGMSPAETHRMVRLLAALPREVTCLIIEHDMDLVFTLADRVSVLHQGEVLAEGLPEAVRGDPRVHEVYLGSAGEA